MLITQHKLKEHFSYVLKNDSVSVLYLFNQPMDEKIKTWTLCFPARENPNIEKALFNQWPIVLQYDVKFFHPSIRLTN